MAVWVYLIVFQFQSPCGEMVYGNVEAEIKAADYHFVSIPLRGNGLWKLRRQGVQAQTYA
ncbi:hypothetical protein [Amazonocrinis nigriterrae]